MNQFASRNTEVTFTPARPFASGETVRMSVSTQIHDALGAPITPEVSQFMARSAVSAG